MTPRRKDESKRVLKEGEYQRDNGTYEFKWRDANGKRHSQYAKTLEELRDKEAEILRDILMAAFVYRIALDRAPCR